MRIDIKLHPDFTKKFEELKLSLEEVLRNIAESKFNTYYKWYLYQINALDCSTEVKEELKSYPEEAFSCPQDDSTVTLSFYRKYILAKNPHKFNSNRLLGIDYYYDPNGKEYWDNGFIITGGPFTKLTPHILRENTPEARLKFGKDSCNEYAIQLIFKQLTCEYVEFFKDMPGFPNVQYDPKMVFSNRKYSNINGGVGIFTSSVMTFTLYPHFLYWSDIHNKNFINCFFTIYDITIVNCMCFYFFKIFFNFSFVNLLNDF